MATAPPLALEDGLRQAHLACGKTTLAKSGEMGKSQDANREISGFSPVCAARALQRGFHYFRVQRGASARWRQGAHGKNRACEIRRDVRGNGGDT
jgi:hypothetical protein